MNRNFHENVIIRHILILVQKGVLIQPDPGFVVKSVLRGTDHKVFINITSSKYFFFKFQDLNYEAFGFE